MSWYYSSHEKSPLLLLLLTSPQNRVRPWKQAIPKGKLIFQPSICMGKNVSFREGTPLQTNITLEIPIFNRKYIFKWWIFHCHVSFRGVYHKTFTKTVSKESESCGKKERCRQKVRGLWFWQFQMRNGWCFQGLPPFFFHYIGNQITLSVDDCHYHSQNVIYKWVYIYIYIW